MNPLAIAGVINELKGLKVCELTPSLVTRLTSAAGMPQLAPEVVDRVLSLAQAADGQGDLMTWASANLDQIKKIVTTVLPRAGIVAHVRCPHCGAASIHTIGGSS